MIHQFSQFELDTCRMLLRGDLKVSLPWLERASAPNPSYTQAAARAERAAKSMAAEGATAGQARCMPRASACLP